MPSDFQQRFRGKIGTFTSNGNIEIQPPVDYHDQNFHDNGLESPSVDLVQQESQVQEKITANRSLLRQMLKMSSTGEEGNGNQNSNQSIINRANQVQQLNSNTNKHNVEQQNDVPPSEQQSSVKPSSKLGTKGKPRQVNNKNNNGSKNGKGTKDAVTKSTKNQQVSPSLNQNSNVTISEEQIQPIPIQVKSQVPLAPEVQDPGKFRQPRVISGWSNDTDQLNIVHEESHSTPVQSRLLKGKGKQQQSKSNMSMINATTSKGNNYTTGPGIVENQNQIQNLNHHHNNKFLNTDQGPSNTITSIISRTSQGVPKISAPSVGKPGPIQTNNGIVTTVANPYLNERGSNGAQSSMSIDAPSQRGNGAQSSMSIDAPSFAGDYYEQYQNQNENSIQQSEYQNLSPGYEQQMYEADEVQYQNQYVNDNQYQGPGQYKQGSYQQQYINGGKNNNSPPINENDNTNHNQYNFNNIKKVVDKRPQIPSKASVSQIELSSAEAYAQQIKSMLRRDLGLAASDNHNGNTIEAQAAAQGPPTLSNLNGPPLTQAPSNHGANTGFPSGTAPHTTFYENDSAIDYGEDPFEVQVTARTTGSQQNGVQNQNVLRQQQQRQHNEVIEEINPDFPQDFWENQPNERIETPEIPLAKQHQNLNHNQQSNLQHSQAKQQQILEASKGGSKQQWKGGDRSGGKNKGEKFSAGKSYAIPQQDIQHGKGSEFQSQEMSSQVQYQQQDQESGSSSARTRLSLHQQNQIQQQQHIVVSNSVLPNTGSTKVHQAVIRRQIQQQGSGQRVIEQIPQGSSLQSTQMTNNIHNSTGYNTLINNTAYHNTQPVTEYGLPVNNQMAHYVNETAEQHGPGTISESVSDLSSGTPQSRGTLNSNQSDTAEEIRRQGREKLRQMSKEGVFSGNRTNGNSQNSISNPNSNRKRTLSVPVSGKKVNPNPTPDIDALRDYNVEKSTIELTKHIRDQNTGGGVRTSKPPLPAMPINRSGKVKMIDHDDRL